MKLAVVGSRSLVPSRYIKWVLDIYRTQENLTEIVTGGAIGTDTVAEIYAKQHDIHLKIFYPKWTANGPRAGFIRNYDIWDYADEGIAFWDGKSKGTAHSFRLAKKFGKTLLVFQDNNLVKYIKHGKEVDLEF